MSKKVGPILLLNDERLAVYHKTHGFVCVNAKGEKAVFAYNSIRDGWTPKKLVPINIPGLTLEQAAMVFTRKLNKTLPKVVNVGDRVYDISTRSMRIVKQVKDDCVVFNDDTVRKLSKVLITGRI